MENVRIETKDTMLVGDGIGKTIITDNKSAEGGYSIMISATVVVTGNGFICKHIKHFDHKTINSDADHSVFYRCSIKGYQDTLFARTNKQSYREFDIYETVDFIFGNVAAVFQNDIIYLRNPLKKTNVITAQSRKSSIESTEFSIHNFVVKAASDLKGVSGVKIYLGRPWRNYSRTVFMKIYLDSLIDPVRSDRWSGKEKMDCLPFIMASIRTQVLVHRPSKGVKWKDYRVIKTVVEAASKFTVGKLIEGDSWLPAIGVPYTSLDKVAPL